MVRTQRRHGVFRIERRFSARLLAGIGLFTAFGLLACSGSDPSRSAGSRQRTAEDPNAEPEAPGGEPGDPPPPVPLPPPPNPEPPTMPLPTSAIPMIGPEVGAAGEVINEFGDRLEQCFARGGSLEECGATASLCFFRDYAVDQLGGGLAEKLQLFELFKNYYCDGECFHCCWVPGAGPGGGGGSCHTSFDASEKPAINCNPGTYGPGTQDLGAALVIGDALGLGICIGGVQQVCNHIAQCNGAGSASFTPSSSSNESAPEIAAQVMGDAGATPHANMSHPGAAPRRAKSFEAAMRRNLLKLLSETPARAARRAYLDFSTARGAVNWRQALKQLAPFDGNLDVFRVEDASGQLRSAASQHRGMLFHATLALMGAVPNLQGRLAYVESRYWTEGEKLAYLEGIDPEAELRKTMGPLALDVLKRVAIQDWRLLAKPAPGETPLPYRSYEGFRLGKPPSVTLAQDCTTSGEVGVAIDLVDAERPNSGDTTYPLVVDWGDGHVTPHVYDSTRSANVVTHAYAEPGQYLVYVSAANATGLRGVAGLVVESAQTGAAATSAAASTFSTVQLDSVVAYGPALISAGHLGLTLQVARSGQTNAAIGWSDVLKLPSAGPALFGNVTGYNEALTPFDSIVLRPRTEGGYRYDSVYLKIPSLTVGVLDLRLGTTATRTLPLRPEMLRVYYAGATAPVPPELLERDVNGDWLIPIERRNTSLPAGFCGATPCLRVERIEIPVSALAFPQTSQRRAVPANLPVGSTARWTEDVPGAFVPLAVSPGSPIAGTCQSSLTAAVVPAAAPRSSLVQELRVLPGDSEVSQITPRRLQAQAVLVDGSTIDVTDQVTWSSSERTAVSISNDQAKGTALPALVPGTSVITATLGDVSATAEVTNSEAARGFRSYRLLITGIHGATGRAGISGVELLAGGRVLESLMTANQAGTVGPFSANVASTAGSNAYLAFDASLGTGWSSAAGSFSRSAPFAVVSSPVYLQVDLPYPVPVHGLRLHRQGGILAASYKPQFPKEVIVQGSNDGVRFETLAQHAFENWNGEPAVVEWTPR
jgi:hypothetical protein